MNERWKEFRRTGYFISTHGNLKNRHGKVMKTRTGNLYKYLSAIISVNGIYSNHFVHRMVAETFLKNPNGKDQINHKDGNKLNNHYKNLEWVSRKENIRHMYDTGLKTYKPLHYKGKFGTEHNRSKSVRCVETGKTWGSMSEAERELNLGGGAVSWSIKHNRPIYNMHFEINS